MTNEVVESRTHCQCCKCKRSSENLDRCCKEFPAWLFKMMTMVAGWFKRTFPDAFQKMLAGVADKPDDCRQTFAKIFGLTDAQLPWRQDTTTITELPPESPEFKPHAFTGGLSEEEQTAKAMTESLKEHQEANLLYPHLTSASPSEPPSYNTLYSDRGSIPEAFVPSAPPSEGGEETDEVNRQRRLYPRL